METTQLHDRLVTIAGQVPCRRLSELTNTNPETIRRYLRGRAPSVGFLSSLCRALGINANWLLTGQGPMRVAEIRPHALREADAAELLTAIADTLTTLIERMDRVERFCQQLDTRLRASSTLVEPKLQATIDDGQAQQPAASLKARRIAGAVAQRPSEDAC